LKELTKMLVIIYDKNCWVLRIGSIHATPNQSLVLPIENEPPNLKRERQAQY